MRDIYDTYLDAESHNEGLYGHLSHIYITDNFEAFMNALDTNKEILEEEIDREQLLECLPILSMSLSKEIFKFLLLNGILDFSDEFMDSSDFTSISKLENTYETEFDYDYDDFYFDFINEIKEQKRVNEFNNKIGEIKTILMQKLAKLILWDSEAQVAF